MAFKQRNGQQQGDPAKLAGAIVLLASEAEPPLRFIAGSTAVDAAEGKLSRVRTELDRWRQLSVGTDGDYANYTVFPRNLVPR